jgi:hypothetical protein
MIKMKKVLSIIFVFLLTISSYAQTEHMKFMGISFDEEINSFISKLKAKHFVQTEKLDDVYLLTGKFAGYNDCTLFIYPSSDRKVKLVAVSFPYCDQWSVLSRNYFDIKDMLIKKYNSPEFSKEIFDSVIEPTDDISKMYEARMERCKYCSEFYTDMGMIKLLIQSVQMHCCVALLYSDEQNSQKSKESAIDDL